MSGMSVNTGGPLVLVVLDGWGLRDEKDYNAIKLARTPTYSELLERFPHSSLTASGEAVGLPAGQMGNSEVGHTTMGAGRVIYQDLTRIDKSIKDGDFFEKKALLDAVNRVKGREPARAHYTWWDCCRPTACTATSVISTRSSSWPRGTSWTACSCTR